MHTKIEKISTIENDNIKYLVTILDRSNNSVFADVALNKDAVKSIASFYNASLPEGF
jgi:hypothetical protein